MSATPDLSPPSGSPPPRRLTGPGWVAIFVGVSVFFVLIWTQLQQSKMRGQENRLKTFGEAPEFALRNQRDETVTLESFAGEPWVVNFIFTRCPGPCPMMTSRMLELQQALERSKDTRVRLATISVDPGFDTPEVLAEYARKVKADPERWQFLTGAPEEVEAVVTKGFLQPLAKEPNGMPAHSTRFVLIDPKGQIRGLREGENPEVVANLLMDLGALMREFPEGAAASSPTP